MTHTPLEILYDDHIMNVVQRLTEKYITLLIMLFLIGAAYMLLY